mmetsp:Transcript_29692/g.76732  ORF Transcript_29692/g.76732 Transcript_29692/m.76732 type:complete len:130 (-) Transcript_29692:178-567(-)
MNSKELSPSHHSAYAPSSTLEKEVEDGAAADGLGSFGRMPTSKRRARESSPARMDRARPPRVTLFTYVTSESEGDHPSPDEMPDAYGEKPEMAAGDSMELEKKERLEGGWHVDGWKGRGDDRLVRGLAS